MPGIYVMSRLQRPLPLKKLRHKIYREDMSPLSDSLSLSLCLPVSLSIPYLSLSLCIYLYNIYLSGHLKVCAASWSVPVWIGDLDPYPAADRFLFYPIIYLKLKSTITFYKITQIYINHNIQDLK